MIILSLHTCLSQVHYSPLVYKLLGYTYTVYTSLLQSSYSLPINCTVFVSTPSLHADYICILLLFVCISIYALSTWPLYLQFVYTWYFLIFIYILHIYHIYSAHIYSYLHIFCPLSTLIYIYFALIYSYLHIYTSLIYTYLHIFCP